MKRLPLLLGLVALGLYLALDIDKLTNALDAVGIGLNTQRQADQD